MTWCFAARALVREYGLDGYAGAIMGEAAGRLTGRVEEHFAEQHKPKFVQAYANGFGFDLPQCIAVGDSRSDIPIFQEAGLAIALNATEQARAAAHVSVETEDLRNILPLILTQSPRAIPGQRESLCDSK